MYITRTRDDLETVLSEWRGAGETIAFVPTMGALHDGHLSLVELAKARADRIVASIFVNPKQFGPNEDYVSYPRDEESDVAKLNSLEVDLVYIPTPEVLYPAGVETDRKAGSAAEGLETDFRPGFFDGVVSVVAQLFEHVKPDVAVFGEKDYQQLMVVREAFPDVALEGAATVRDEYGLALSSRNAYLSDDEIAVARRLNVILSEAAASLQVQRSNPKTLHEALDCRVATLLAMTERKILEVGFHKVDYVAERWGRVLAAAHIGKTRLIDNVEIS